MSNPIKPDHYRKYEVETIDMMLAIFGVEATINFCTINAFKYRMRLGHKDGIQQDLDKEAWYLAKATELRDSLNDLRMGFGVEVNSTHQPTIRGDVSELQKITYRDAPVQPKELK